MLNKNTYLILQDNYLIVVMNKLTIHTILLKKFINSCNVWSKIRNTIFENNNNRLKPIGLPFIPKKLSKNEYYTALAGFAMVSDVKHLPKKYQFTEDFVVGI